MGGNCYYCGPTDRDLRPYGPGGATVCFPCATGTPEREAAAKAAFGAQLDAMAAVTDIVVIGQAQGPTTLEDALGGGDHAE